MPTARAATIGRLVFRASIATLKPAPPSGPRRLSAPSCTLSKNSGQDGTPRAPILSSLRPTLSPGVALSTMNMLMPSGSPCASCVFAATRMKSAMSELVHQIFEPFRT
jgi:hypothetical protein